MIDVLFVIMFEFVGMCVCIVCSWFVWVLLVDIWVFCFVKILVLFVIVLVLIGICI